MDSVTGTINGTSGLLGPLAFRNLLSLNGGQGGSRTPDTRIFSPLLYQLSYLALGNRLRILHLAKYFKERELAHE